MTMRWLRSRETTGELTFVEAEFDGVGGVNGLDYAYDLAVSPDGQHVYVAAFNNNAIAVFSRNGTTGELTFVEAQLDGVGGVDGLYGAAGVAVSSEGAHVYVCGWLDNAVATFSRNETTGELTFVEVQAGNGLIGLHGPIGVAVPPDGRHVYVVGSDFNALLAYSRNETTGELTYVETEYHGVGGVDGLERGQYAAVSPDGRHVYVASFWDAVSAFRRNETTGELTFIEAERDGVGGVDGLHEAYSVAVSPDGEHVYVTGGGDSAVAVFSREPPIVPTPTLTLVGLTVLALALVGLGVRHRRLC
jgi:6-phosphogluconolactonase (cycloisomerase 2 family)